MTGFQLVRQEMQNGGILHSTMLLPWLELVFLVSLMPWLNLDGIFLVSFSTFILQRLSRNLTHLTFEFYECFGKLFFTLYSRLLIR